MSCRFHAIRKAQKEFAYRGFGHPLISLFQILFTTLQHIDVMRRVIKLSIKGFPFGLN